MPIVRDRRPNLNPNHVERRVERELRLARTQRATETPDGDTSAPAGR